MKRSDARWYLSKVKRTISQYKMLEAEDSVAVGLSGGKDSAVLLYILKLFQKHAPFSFNLYAVYIDLGWDMDLEPLYKLTEKLNVPLHIEETAISRIVFQERKEKNPCALCANMRRGALNLKAKSLGANKVALGHHLDDAIQTLFLNIIYTGQMDVFKPSTYLDRTDITIIRPLIQIPEITISSLASREKLPVAKNPCPASGKTRRHDMAEITNDLATRYPDFYRKFSTAFYKSPFWQ